MIHVHVVQSEWKMTLEIVALQVKERQNVCVLNLKHHRYDVCSVESYTVPDCG